MDKFAFIIAATILGASPARAADIQAKPPCVWKCAYPSASLDTSKCSEAYADRTFHCEMLGIYAVSQINSEIYRTSADSPELSDGQIIAAIKQAADVMIKRNNMPAKYEADLDSFSRDLLPGIKKTLKENHTYQLPRQVSEKTVLPPATSRQEYCRGAATPGYFKKLLYDERNRLAFSNSAGKLGIGLCWWHSRFNRSAVYLTFFRPDMPKPNRRGALTIIKRIISDGYVTAVPGYRNLNEFTTDWDDLITGYLSDWQLREATFGACWIRGLLGDYQNPPQVMKAMMDRLYDETMTKDNMTYIKLQMPGPDAHAVLIVDMKKTPDGYIVRYLDNNSQDQLTAYTYFYGDTHFIIYDSFPYLEETGAMRKIKRTIHNFCSGKGPSETPDIFVGGNAGNFPHGTAKPSPNYK